MDAKTNGRKIVGNRIFTSPHESLTIFNVNTFTTGNLLIITSSEQSEHY